MGRLRRGQAGQWPECRPGAVSASEVSWGPSSRAGAARMHVCVHVLTLVQWGHQSQPQNDQEQSPCGPWEWHSGPGPLTSRGAQALPGL